MSQSDSPLWSHWTPGYRRTRESQEVKGQEPAEAEKEQRRERGGEGTEHPSSSG